MASPARNVTLVAHDPRTALDRCNLPTEATDGAGCGPISAGPPMTVMDRTHDGRKFRMLTVIDEFTRRCMAVVARAKMRTRTMDSIV